MTYPKQDLEFVQRLLTQGGATKYDMDQIFLLYNKYIQPGTVGYTSSGCASCSSDIHKIWEQLRGYILTNSAKFVD